MKEHDIVMLLKSLNGILIGAKGTIVHEYDGEDVYEVEFETKGFNGNSRVVTVPADCLINMGYKEDVIAQQDRIIGQLTREVENLQDSERKRRKWLKAAKEQAGYSNMTSFDIVWEETLKKALSKE